MLTILTIGLIVVLLVLAVGLIFGVCALVWAVGTIHKWEEQDENTKTG